MATQRQWSKKYGASTTSLYHKNAQTETCVIFATSLLGRFATMVSVRIHPRLRPKHAGNGNFQPVYVYSGSQRCKLVVRKVSQRGHTGTLHLDQWLGFAFAVATVDVSNTMQVEGNEKALEISCKANFISLVAITCYAVRSGVSLSGIFFG